MRALVTGFDPFGGGRVNASLEAVRRLPARIGTFDIVTAVLPTSYARSIPALKAAIRDARPAIVLCVGEAGDRSQLSVERVAVNLQDARIPDNDGAAPADRPVVRGGPAAYFATLPVRKMVAALRAAELPAELSSSAGTFVCNHVFYGLMRVAATARRSFRGGFLHVPCLTRQHGTAAPSMALDDIVRGILICVDAATPD
ncbi:MAG TPA: pyroglutamyl-peptidase I [Burkholderiales bacterium]|nr:pyroglutamyl-peptidase I [Burkholderiales bacterium]